MLGSTFTYTDPKEWCNIYNNWEHMSLKDNIRLKDNFYLITLAVWMKLKLAHGGGPEIPFFMY